MLPGELRPRLAYGAMIVPGGHVPTVIGDRLSSLRGAVSGRCKVRIAYPRPFADHGERTIRPLALAYWGGSWTLGAWCEATAGFRTFRVDGIASLRVSTETFPDEPGRRLADYLAAAPGHDAVLGAAVDSLRAGEPLWPTAVAPTGRRDKRIPVE